MLNVSGDEVLDVVIGFGTGADGYNIPDFVCDIYFDGQKPCLGGILALDGRTGKELWRLWTNHEIFALTCQADLNGDGYVDCLAGGRAGVFLAVDIRTGEKLWEFEDHAIKSDLMSVFAAQFVQDLDGDGVLEVLAVHGGDGLADPGHDNMYGRLIIFSGKTGKLMRWMATPDRRESYYPPQVITGPDGREMIIYGTGGNLNNGALYAISLLDLYRKNVTQMAVIYRDPIKGILNPASLVDLTGDGVADIVLASMNANVMAFDGVDYTCLWNKTFPSMESISALAVGSWDRDDVPDIMVKYNYGAGFPVYEYQQTMVLSGKTGEVISSIPIDSITSQSSPLVLSIEGRGNDVFLHWSSNCRGHRGEKLKYGFREGTHVHEQLRADICNALFSKPGQESLLVAVSNMFPGSRGTALYNSTFWARFEHEGVVNTSALADAYLAAHPEIEEALEGVPDGEEYSVLPYKNKQYASALRLLEEEMAREYAGEQMILDLHMKSQPKADFYPNLYLCIHSHFLAGQRPLLDPDTLAYAEGEPGQLLGDDDGGGDYENESEPLAEKRGQLFPDDGGQVDYQQGYRPPPQGPPPPFQGGGGGYRGKRKTSEFLREKREIPLSTPSPPLPPLSFQGVHRQSATGTLAPSLVLADDTMDVIVPVYWIYPPRVEVLQEDDLSCISQRLKPALEKLDASSEDSEEE